MHRSDSRFEILKTRGLDGFGAIAVIWGIAFAILIVGAPIAFGINLALRLARMVAPSL